jgi:hypothetical protein
MFRLYKIVPAVLLLAPACGNKQELYETPAATTTHTIDSTVKQTTRYVVKERVSGPMSDETIEWDAEDME